MKFGIYTIFDKASEQGGPLMICKNDAVAVRALRASLKDVFDVSYYKLLCVGEFDDEKCLVFGTEGMPREVVVPAMAGVKGGNGRE